MSRHPYAQGFKTAQAAHDALEDAYAQGEVSPCELPKVSTYRVILTDGSRVMRWQITLAE